MLKAGLRPLFKGALAWEAENELHQRGEDGAALGVHLASFFYSLFSEQADLRSWQTLPAQIWLVRLFLPAGEYQFKFGAASLGFVRLERGETKFLKVRTW